MLAARRFARPVDLRAQVSFGAIYVHDDTRSPQWQAFCLECCRICDGMRELCRGCLAMRPFMTIMR